MDLLRAKGGNCIGRTEGRACLKTTKSGWLCYPHYQQLKRYARRGAIWFVGIVVATIISYFVLQSMDIISGKEGEDQRHKDKLEKDIEGIKRISHPYLSSEYPLGYAVVWINGNQTHLSNSEPLKVGYHYTMELESIKAARQDSNIVFTLPELRNRNGDYLIKGYAEVKMLARPDNRFMLYGSAGMPRPSIFDGIGRDERKELREIIGNSVAWIFEDPPGYTTPFWSLDIEYDVYVEYLSGDKREATMVVGLKDPNNSIGLDLDDIRSRIKGPIELNVNGYKKTTGIYLPDGMRIRYPEY